MERILKKNVLISFDKEDDEEKQRNSFHLDKKKTRN